MRKINKPTSKINKTKTSILKMKNKISTSKIIETIISFLKLLKIIIEIIHDMEN